MRISHSRPKRLSTSRKCRVKGIQKSYGTKPAGSCFRTVVVNVHRHTVQHPARVQTFVVTAINLLASANKNRQALKEPAHSSRNETSCSSCIQQLPLAKTNLNYSPYLFHGNCRQSGYGFCHRYILPYGSMAHLDQHAPPPPPPPPTHTKQTNNLKKHIVLFLHCEDAISF